MGDAVRANTAPLTNDELAEWVSNEVRKFELHARERLETAENKAWADKDPEQGARARAIIAGQQAIRRDLPHLALSGDFSATPAPQGGWTVRYSVRRADSFGGAPFGVVECVVAADGTVVQKSPDVIMPNHLQREVAVPRSPQRNTTRGNA
jgi:hypothetical protein